MEVVEESYVNLYQALAHMCTRSLKDLPHDIITINVKFIWYVILNIKDSTYSFTKPNFEVYSRIKHSIIRYDVGISF
jgi:hypothetical protein